MANAWRTRRHLRVPHEAPLILRVNRTHKKNVRLTQKNLTAKMLDISDAGCGVEAAFFIPKGTRVNIFLDRSQFHLKSAPEARGFSRIVAVVASCVTRGIKKYRFGLQFAHVSKTDRDLLSKFVKSHERRREPRVEL